MKDWIHTVLGPHIDLLSGHAFKSDMYSSDEEDVKLLRGDNIVQGQLRWEGVKRWRPSEVNGLARYQLENGDIVLAMDRTWINAGLKCARVSPDDLPCLLVQRVARIRGANELDTRFLYQTLHTHRFTQYVKGVQTETAVPHISAQQIREFPVHLPPLPEQQKIAAILSTWDQAIEFTEKLIAAKQRRKQALMQQLLTGKVRFAVFVNSTARQHTQLGDMPLDWKTFRFSQLVKKVRRKNDAGEEHVLTASGEFGLVDQREFFNRSVAGADLSKYYLLKRGDFAYNRSAMNGYPYGAFKRLDRYEQGVLSILYICFALKDTKSCDSDFLSHFFEGRLLDRQLRGITQVGGRAHGLLNIIDGDFYSMTLVMPSVEEQRKIAAVLNTQDREIQKLKDRTAALRHQKQGLMQKLLTGSIRVGGQQ